MAGIATIRAEAATAVRNILVSTALAAVAALIGAVWWTLRSTWRRILPFYWMGATLACGLLVRAQHPTVMVRCVLLVVGVLIAGGWHTSRVEVRAYRVGVVGLLGVVAVTGFIAAAPVVAGVLGWPWWHHLRTWAPPDAGAGEDTPASDDNLTEHWRDRWQTEVLDEGFFTGVALQKARQPRRGVVECALRLPPGGEAEKIASQAGKIGSCLDLNVGCAGYELTEKIRNITLVLVERSHIRDTVPYWGPTWEHRGVPGRIRAMVYADGSPGIWTMYRPGFGTPNGLVVGSTGAGKSRALGVLADSALSAGFGLIIGDAQDGQSLPAWRHAASEYHAGADTVAELILRLEAEVSLRSRMLGDVGVEAYDLDDPRITELGIDPLEVLIDECQIVLHQQSKRGRRVVKAMEYVMATCRKTGVGVTLGTQIPQMSSLGNSSRIRDAAVAGNTIVLRLSNKRSKGTILPDGFPGDPFKIPAEIRGKTTAGTGYLGQGERLGMLARVPFLVEADAAASAPRVPFTWLAGPVMFEDASGGSAPPLRPAARQPEATDARRAQPTRSGNTMIGRGAERLRAAFGVPTTTPLRAVGSTPPQGPASTKEWLVRTLRRAPQSAVSLLDRTDCPVSKPQLYAVLSQLAEQGTLIEPPKGGTWSVKP